MPKIKLKEWAAKHDLSYLTANRHFHAGMIPGAVQLDSGTILVEDDSVEQNMAANTSNEAMSLFLKKTVEFSKNNSTVEDFAAFVISNFQLKLNGVSDNPRYSKNKPKSEEIQKHFQQFLPDKESVEHLKAVKTLLKEGKTAGDVTPASDLSPDIAQITNAIGETKPFERVSNSEGDTLDFFEQMLDESASSPSITTGGLVTRSVDLNTTPQQINYTGSTSQAFSSSLSPSMNLALADASISGDVSGGFVEPTVASVCFNSTQVPFAGPFQPTQKEFMSAAKVIETSETEMPRKRGRKPAKKR